MLKNIYSKLLLVVFVLFIVSCEKDDTPEVVHEHEEFTLVTLDVTNLDTSVTEKYEFEIEGHDHDHDHGDDDGDDHDDAHKHVDLEANSSYSFEWKFYNDEDPLDIEDLTSEVIDEVDEHQFFYQFADSNTGITIASASNDIKDKNNFPLMLNTTWTTTTTGVFDVTAALLHEPTSKSLDYTTIQEFCLACEDFTVEFEVHVD